MTQVLKALGSVVTSTFLDKPEYNAVKSEKDKGYEERHYKQEKWVSTKVVGMLHEKARSTGFRRLFNYIQGTNEKGMKIDMTTPVTTKIEPGAGPNCESTFTVSFYIPPTHQEAPPKPSDPEVFIEDRQAMTVLVRQFGGFANEETWLKEAEELTKKVQENKEKVNEGCWYTAGYNSPYQMFGRANEIWFIKE
ncbi:hypothetical protein FSP39_017085 [Pinctada imbricata]|uniref:Heme-binding protein 2 n=1 Tax=Pinctada imbricata TaxID=66713 RepID=A0AA88YEB3_PINIB|nr:hypothetical protein FSP39_017085 [Pinctada imbricata]